MVEADKQWASGCVRLEAYVQDGEQRLQEEKTLRERDAQAALATGKATTPLRAASVAGSFSNSSPNPNTNPNPNPNPTPTPNPNPTPDQAPSATPISTRGSTVSTRTARTSRSARSRPTSGTRPPRRAWSRVEP